MVFSIAVFSENKNKKKPPKQQPDNKKNPQQNPTTTTHPPQNPTARCTTVVLITAISTGKIISFLFLLVIRVIFVLCSARG